MAKAISLAERLAKMPAANVRNRSWLMKVKQSDPKEYEPIARFIKEWIAKQHRKKLPTYRHAGRFLAEHVKESLQIEINYDTAADAIRRVERGQETL